MSKTGTNAGNNYQWITPYGSDNRIQVRNHKHTPLIGTGSDGVNYFCIYKRELPEYGDTNCALIWVDDVTFNNL